METYRFKEGDYVIIHSLGPSHGNKEYRGIIRGLSIRDFPVWIIQQVDIVDTNYPFSAVTMPDACVRKAN
jgi:hypothetical protein